MSVSKLFSIAISAEKLGVSVKSEKKDLVLEKEFSVLLGIVTTNPSAVADPSDAIALKLTLFL